MISELLLSLDQLPKGRKPQQLPWSSSSISHQSSRIEDVAGNLRSLTEELKRIQDSHKEEIKTMLMGIQQAVASNSALSSSSVKQPILTTPQEVKTTSTEGSTLVTPP